MNLFRKRFFPDELIELNDEVVVCDEEKIITKWKAIRPKPDLDHGISCFFINEGIKVSKFYRRDGSLIYWYCDIGECVCDKENDKFTFVDLLADVIVYPDGEVRVVDLGEVADIFQSGSLEAENVCKLLRRLDKLLDIIYNGKFRMLQDVLDNCEKSE